MRVMPRTGSKSKTIVAVFVTAIILLTGISVSAQGMTAGSRSAIPGLKLNQVLNFHFEPQFARFVSDDPDLVLWGNLEGLKILKLSTGDILSEALPGVAITALRVNPIADYSALAATQDGNLYRVNFQDENLKVTEISFWAGNDRDVIRNLAFHPVNQNIVLAGTSKVMVLSEDSGETWDTSHPIEIPWSIPSPIVMVCPDPNVPETLLISGIENQRYRMNWKTREFSELPEVAVVHGFEVDRTGESFVLIGKHARVLNFNYLALRGVDMVRHPVESNVFFIAGIGKSLLRVRFDKSNYKIDYLNQRIFLTFSVDVHPSSPDNIIFTTTSGVHLSTDGGSTWSRSSR